MIVKAPVVPVHDPRYWIVLAVFIKAEAVEITPVPLELMVRLVFVPESITAIAAVPPDAPAVILIPDLAEAVDASTEKMGFVEPLGPTAIAVAPADVTMTGTLVCTLPVDVPARVIVPEPLASIVRLVFVPLSITAIAAVPPDAPAVIFTPALAEAVEASMLNVGLVPPLGPTANAVAPALVAISAPVESMDSTVASALAPVPEDPAAAT